jgi:hypothetical protein
VAFTAGHNLTAQELADAIGVIRVKSTPKTMNNNTTYSPDAELAIAVAANTTYIFESLIIYSAAAAADAKVAFTGPAGYAASGTPDSLPTSTAGSTDSIDRGVADFTAPTFGVPMGGRGTGVGNRSVARPAGYIAIGAAAGTITLNFAQVTANVSDAVLYAGSWLKLTKAS